MSLLSLPGFVSLRENRILSSDVVEISCWLVGGAGGEGLSSLPSGERQRASRLSSARGTAARVYISPAAQSNRCYSSNNLCGTLYYNSSSGRWILVLFVLRLLGLQIFCLLIIFGCGKSCSLISVVCFVLLRSVFRGLVESHIFCFNLFNIVSRITF